MTETNVEALLAAVVDAARDELGGRLSAVYAIGSLAHGGFVPAVSDVDVALVLGELGADDAGLGPRLVAVAGARTADPLAGRLSIFWCDRGRLESGGYDAGRFPPPDRLDLARAGRLLFGEDLRERIRVPGREQLVVTAAAFAVDQLGGPDLARGLRDPRALARAGVRTVTKTTLFPVRFLYTAATGEVGSNDDAAGWYAQDGTRPGSELVAAAAAWRAAGLPPGDGTAALLGRDLEAIYEAFAVDYAARMEALGRPDLAQALRTLPKARRKRVFERARVRRAIRRLTGR